MSSTRDNRYQSTRDAVMPCQSILSRELMNKLLPEVKSGQTAVAITLIVTTRSIGFGTVTSFLTLFDYTNVPIRGTVYQHYRIALAMMEVKLQVVQRANTTVCEYSDDYYEPRNTADYVETITSRVIMPDVISRTINSIGIVKVYDSVYVPKIAADRTTRDGLFIPQSERVWFYNLRRTVTALANPDVPQEFRRRFYNNNPIPGAIWQNAPDNPILANADEIMPDGYDLDQLHEDIEEVQAKVNFMARKIPKLVTDPVSYEPSGGKELLVCNDQGGLRIADRRQDENLNDYYRRMKIEGNISEYHSLQALTPAEQISANLCLLGERPTYMVGMYPAYTTRDSRTCNHVSSLSYKSARVIAYAT